jgi:hypothetical protein
VARVPGLVSAALLVACSDGADPAAAGAQGDAAAEGGSSWSGDELRARIVVPDVDPGREAHVCTTTSLPNDRDVWVTRLSATIGGGSHHLIADRARFDAVSDVPTPCLPLSGTDATRLLIAQQPQTEFELPEGVAYRLSPFQLLTLELHYANTSSKSMTIEGEVVLHVMPAGWAPEAEAAMEFTGTVGGIYLEPHSPGSASHFTGALGEPGDPSHVFALTSHTHARGVRATIERAKKGATGGELLHESLDWAEPPLTRLDPPLAFDGEDGLLLTCEYQNDTDGTIVFGTNVDSEMCFMWTYYYPARPGGGY